MTVGNKPTEHRRGSYADRWKYAELCDGGYLPVPNVLLVRYATLNPPITLLQLVFLLEVMYHKRDKRAPWPGYRTLAKRMDVSVKSVRRCAGELEQSGCLKRELRTGATNLFHLDGFFLALLNAETEKRRAIQEKRHEDAA